MKLTWITNQPAHYRYPIWIELSKLFDLKVVFTGNRNNNQGWELKHVKGFEQKTLKLRHLIHPELEIPTFELFFLIKELDIFVTTAWQSPFSQVGLFSAMIFKKRRVIIYESTSESHNFNNFLIKSFRRFILGLADFVVTVGESSTSDVVSLGIPKSKIVELFNPVDVNSFHAASMSNRNHQLNSGHRFMFVGQLIPRKNLIYLLEAFSLIANPNDSLMLVGEGELREKLEELSQTLGISHQVKFIGFVEPDQLPLIYAAADTLVLPSKQEVWGLVVNEALASGAQVVVSRNAGVAASIKEMRGVYLCDPDIESISSAMKKSRIDYDGPIKSPEILSFTPEKFANLLVALCKIGL